MTSPLQSTIYQGYGTAAAILGQPYDQYRAGALQTPIVSQNKLATVSAQFTSGKTAGYNFNKPINYDDILFAGLFDATSFLVGDYLVSEATGQTYFIVSMENLLPVLCTECNRMISLSRTLTDIGTSGGATPVRQPSQTGGAQGYFGRGIDSPGATSPLNQTIATGIPVCMVANAGRATGELETPSGAPGPSRWRIYLPVGVFPKGSVRDRDLITDEEGSRHLVSVAAWTSLGYRLEAIREEL